MTTDIWRIFLLCSRFFSLIGKAGNWKLAYSLSYFRRATGYPGPGIIPSHRDILYYTRVCILKIKTTKVLNHLELRN
jgi:hypothetical protein